MSYATEYGELDPHLSAEALAAEQSGEYKRAISLYEQLTRSATKETTRSALTIRTSILKEADRLGFDQAVPLMLEALTARQDKLYVRAIEVLQQIERDHPDSYLRDDAIYLIGYIALMDQYDFPGAERAMTTLLRDFPGSKYTDTALYSGAIALEQQGNTESAKALFLRLRDRHSEFSIDFINRAWPKSAPLSRYWFDRADKRLAILRDRVRDAARIVGSDELASGNSLKVRVNAEGRDLVLLLTPSAVMRRTQMEDESTDYLRAQLYEGQVEGAEKSWVRVSIAGDSIEGVVQRDGERYRLNSQSMIGTIEYYQPRSRKNRQPGVQYQDYVVHPPGDSDGDGSVDQLDTDHAGFSRVSGSAKTVSKLAKLAIVVDSQYDSYYGGQGLNQALFALNVADGIYRDKFGLALEVITAKVISNRSYDPMNLGSVSLETMLRNFRDYRMQRSDDYSEASLVYLFSGNQNSDPAIGLAWIGAACRLDGFDVGVTTPSSFADLLVTHELGHSLGAQHDTDTDCSGEANHLMWPRISSATRQDFSQCSRSVISTGLDAWCLSDAIDVALEWQDTDLGGLTLGVRNNDSSRTVQDALLTLDRTGVPLQLLSDSCVDAGQGEVSCRTGQLSPGQVKSFRFDLTTAPGQSTSMLAELSPLDFEDVSTGNNSVQIDISVDQDGYTEIVAIGVDNPDAGNDAAGVIPPADAAGSPSGNAGGSGSLTTGAIALLALLNLSSAWSRITDKSRI